MATEKVGPTHDPKSCHSQLRNYLKCVYECVDHAIDNERLIGEKLSDLIQPKDEPDVYDTKRLLRACALLQPSVVFEGCFFINTRLYRSDEGKNFIDIKEAKQKLPNFQTDKGSCCIDVGSNSYKVERVMIFNFDWLDRNFVQPFTLLANDLEAKEEKSKMEVKGVKGAADKKGTKVGNDTNDNKKQTAKSQICHIL